MARVTCAKLIALSVLCCMLAMSPPDQQQYGCNFPRLFTGHDPTRGSGQGGFKISRVGSGRVKTFQNVTGRSGRVGSRGFKISRVESGRVSSVQNIAGRARSGRARSGRVRSGRVKRFQNLTSRVGSGQEAFKISRVRSGYNPRDTGHSRVKPP